MTMATVTLWTGSTDTTTNGMVAMDTECYATQVLWIDERAKDDDDEEEDPPPQLTAYRARPLRRGHNRHADKGWRIRAPPMKGEDNDRTEEQPAA